MNEDTNTIIGVSGSTCHNCSRYIGPTTECHYCGCETAQSKTLKILRWISIFIGISGLALLLVMSANSEAPVKKISSITPMMNFAYVRIEGTVEREPFISKSNGIIEYLSFLVNDDSGSMRVAAYDKTAKEIEQKGLVPKKDSQVNVAGTISVSGNGKAKLVIRTVEDIFTEIRSQRSEVSK